MAADGETVKKPVIVLETPGDWSLWYRYITGYARTLGVEEYVDLANETVFMDVDAPVEPDDRASDADWTIFERKEARYLRKQEAISKVWERIWSSVDRRALDLATRDNKDTKDIVRALHKHLCPSIPELQRDVRKRFWRLMGEPDHRSIETWLDSWLIFEKDLEDAQLISSFDLKADFLEVNYKLYAPLAEAWDEHIQMDSEGEITFDDTIKFFRTRYRELDVARKGFPQLPQRIASLAR
ncbi:hypothetical protein FQN50_007118 [Emmonsiellopsis sp. PD_5]|nr:hypothetical protein FQN50_007118 [Emmonsiellopsis sp. PD_5]